MKIISIEMEEQSQINYDQQDEELNQSNFSFYPNEIEFVPNINNDDKEDYGDFKELINLFEQKKPKKSKSKDKNYSCFIEQSEILSKSLNYGNIDVFKKKLEQFLLRAYKLICEDNEQNELIDKEEIDDNSDNKDEIKFLNILNEYIKNKKEHNKMEISIQDEKCSFNENFFIIKLKERHKINMCNDLLKIKIKIKLEVKILISNGNSQITFFSMEIKYNGDEPKLKLKPNLKCSIINSFIGKRGITFCTCNNCERCKNREIFPFDDLLDFLKEKNKINNKLKLTYLYFKGYNSYKNDSNYKCSFCKDFYIKKSNIIRLFCNHKIDPDHTCQFWICRDCYFSSLKYGTEEVCPNCKRFRVNFSILKSYYKWKNYLKNE